MINLTLTSSKYGNLMFSGYSFDSKCSASVVGQGCCMISTNVI